MERPKNIEEFSLSLEANQPPSTWSSPLQALWWDAKADWDKAHDIVDQMHTPTAKWIHAYLHRKEGDLWNADYWYKSAGRSRPANSLKAEFTEIFNKARFEVD